MKNKALDSRKFIEMILKTSSRWLNWNPPIDIMVGDYGKLNSKTGELDREGNIYVDMHIYEDEDIVKLVKAYPPIEGTREEMYCAKSKEVKGADFKLCPEVKIPGLADASVKGQWAFGSTKGVLVVMAHPRCSFIPGSTLAHRLGGVQALKDMCIVTEVFSCPAYFLYTSNGNNEVIDLALLGSLPVPNAPGMTAGGEIKGKWWVQNASEHFRCACDPDGKDSFRPLYKLKMTKQRSLFDIVIRRLTLLECDEAIVEHQDDDAWAEVQIPWDLLDEDGNEEEFEDTASPKVLI